jgi:hypothetical protein
VKYQIDRRILLVAAVAILALAAVILATGNQGQVAAQGEGQLWLSSAEAPAGTPLESLSPPDGPTTGGPDSPDSAPESPDALISWRVVGSALKPRSSDVSFSVDTNGSCTYVTAGSNFTVWNTTPDLPQGTVVDTVRMYYYDTSGSNSTGWFTIYDLYGAIVQEWSVSSAGSSGYSFNDTVQINHTVDYSTYSYVLNWRPVVTGSTMQLCGFRIFHEPPLYRLGYLPSILNQP